MKSFSVQFYFASFNGGPGYPEGGSLVETIIERDYQKRGEMILEITRNLKDHGFYTIETGRRESVVISAAVLRYFIVSDRA